MKKHVEKLKNQDNQERKVDIQNGHKEESETHIDQEQKLESQNEHHKELVTENEHEQYLDSENEFEQKLETEIDEEQKLETEIDDEQKLEIQNDEHEQYLNSNNEIEPKLETEIDEEQKLEIHNDEYEQWNKIEQSSSFHNDNEEQTEEKTEPEMSADELDENNETTIDNHEDKIQRPDSVSLTNGHNEPFIESNTASPITEIKSQSSPQDPMTTSFIDGDPNTQNPFIEKIDDITDDEMEIIHHDISTSNKHSMPSIEDINPQGLPIENNIHSVKPPVKKSNNNRSNR